ncbi:HU family DNA-binding protein [Mesonia sp. HuA40]|uniref:HU family DNA-binding protein n=1 Tax=Mesonia sp. HuA40 TaxID=2602761 RepID=UPI0011C9A577|nr:HU family DNA-binding protein [Mesonia sp. HuA40]TXK74046.1 DNA-binding protein [Mesonia sp. HuA40]
MSKNILAKLNVRTRKNPQDRTAAPLYYVQAVSTGTCDLDRLAYLISNQSTVREPDCLAVLHAFVHNMLDELEQGRIVELGRLGNFQVGVGSTGSALAEDVSLSNIKRIALNYRPSKHVKKRIKNMDFSLAD